MGVPTVTLATQPFEHAARTAARGHSLPDLPIVTIPHDYLFEDEAAIRKQVESVIGPLLGGLFAPPPGVS
ncbi:MAG: hypothetical protein JRG84_07960 [Deltaproteobacteria bacterium]|nr:hypothetical protein [Deltaproteobacteria bacterium]